MKDKSTKKESHLTDYKRMTTYDAGVLQASVHRMLQRETDNLLRPYGITKAQWLIIGIVLDNSKHGIRISELANKLDTTLSYLTNTINLLESKNILVRATDDEDTRAKVVTVHTEFFLKCPEIEKTVRNGLRDLIYGRVESEDFNTYMKVLYQLSEIEKH